MKYKLATHDFRIIDGKLFIIGSSSLIEMDFNENMRLSKDPKRKIKILSNVIAFDLSPDKKTFAVKNTSGHIAVYNYVTGELLFKNKCTNREGNEIYYISDHQIVSTDWNSNLIVLDVNTKKWTLIHDFGVDKVGENVNFVSSIYPISQNDYVVSKGRDELYFIHLDAENFEIKHKYRFEDLNMDCLGIYVNRNANKVIDGFFITTRWLNINGKVDFFVCFVDFKTKKTNRIINLSNILALKEDYFSLKALEVSFDLRRLILGDSKNIYVIDLEYEKVTKKIEKRFISRITYCFDNTKLLVGTWEDLSFIDISELSK